MLKEEIIEYVKKIEGLGGMTVNERLYVTGISQVITKQENKYLDEQDAKNRQLSLNFDGTE